MTLALDHLPQPDSLLSRLDPRWKLAALMLAAFSIALLRTVSAASLAMGGAFLLVALARVSFRWYLSRLGGLAVFLLALVLLLPFVIHDGGPSVRLGFARLSWYGLGVAACLCLKALALVTLVLVALTTAPLGTTLKAAHALYVPSLIVQLIMLTHRYIFVLGAELSRLRIALCVRGFRNRAALHSYHTVSHVAGTLLVRGYERAERVAQAMRCRGFDGRFRSLAEFRTTGADVLFFILVVSSAIALLLADFLQR